jgi:hypothetical protein
MDQSGTHDPDPEAVKKAEKLSALGLTEGGARRQNY